MNRAARLALVCGAAGLLVSACDKGQSAATAPPLDALPLSTAVTPSTPAPAATRLPSARPAPLGRLARPEDSYAYLDRAYAAADAYADAPPDYTVDYDGERPWIWRASDSSERVVERTPQGLRYYYYQPGASEPYLVQDEGYTYAYSDGRLVAVYGPGGELEPYDYVQRRAAVAGRYLAWASALYIASQQQQRFAVEQTHWDERRADIAAQRAAWNARQSRDAAWAAYHQAHGAEEQAHWAPEQERRNAEVVRYANAPPPGPRPVAGYGQGPGYTPAPGHRQGPGPAPYAAGPPNGGYNGAPAPYGQAADGGQPLLGAHRFTGPEQGGVGGPRFAQGAAEPGRPGYDPSGPQAAPGVAAAQRQATFDQARAQAEAQRQAAEQAHAAQQQQARAAQAQAQTQAQARTQAQTQFQARAQAEQQRQQALQQSRGTEQAQGQAAEQAHAAQQQQARATQVQQQAQRQAAQAAQQQAAQQQAAHAAEAQRSAALQQSRAAAEVQDQAAAQAHAAQAAQAHAAAEAQRRAHQAPPNAAHDHPHAPGEQTRRGQQP